jgi:hypothetical protein
VNEELNDTVEIKGKETRSAEVGMERTEDRGQRPEDRGQKSVSWDGLRPMEIATSHP